MCTYDPSFEYCEDGNESENDTSDYDDFNHLFPSTILTKLDDNQRTIFFILFLITFSLSMIGNIATLCTTYERKIRLVQKMLIVSLALSDIIVCVFIGVNNMINFSHPMTNWILGEFMCCFIPYIQILGSVANSITMVSIAFDRYANIIHPHTKQWDPNLLICIFLLIFIWGLSAGVSYPMFTFMTLRPIKIILTDDQNNVLSTDILNLYICVTWNKQSHQIFYSIMFTIIFVPLMLAFLYFYYKIAKLIWRQRKVGSKSTNKPSVTMETSIESKTSGLKQSILAKQKATKTKPIINKLHMERKIRTFKIILVIMFVFFICRMPHWIFNMIKFSEYLNSRTHWIIANALSLLLIVNTTLNPFLYSFLNQTIMYFDRFFISVGEFISNICCCCCTNDFDEFEKKNPFFNENYEPKDKSIQKGNKTLKIAVIKTDETSSQN